MHKSRARYIYENNGMQLIIQEIESGKDSQNLMNIFWQIKLYFCKAFHLSDKFPVF